VVLAGGSAAPRWMAGQLQDHQWVENGSLNAQALFSGGSVCCPAGVDAADIVSAVPDAIAAARTGGPAGVGAQGNISRPRSASKRGYNKAYGAWC